jgi:hypothetical protein
VSSTGNVFAGTGENNAGIGATAWTNPGNIGAQDGSEATCNAGASSQYLVARNFGLAVPGGSSIQGITVRVEASEHTAGAEVLNARLQDDTGTLVGLTKGNSLNGTTKAVYTYGAASDQWGLGSTLTAAMVNDADFGVRLWFTTAHDVRVDYVTLAVEYTVGGATLSAAATTITSARGTVSPETSKTPIGSAVTLSQQSIPSLFSETPLVGEAITSAQGVIDRPHGQQIDSAQGSVTPTNPLTGSAITSAQGDVEPPAVAATEEEVSGEESVVAAGDLPAGISVRMRSRKGGGGAAANTLSGQATTSAAGLFTPISSKAPTTQVASLLQGAFTKQSAAALAGSSLTGSTGSIAGPPAVIGDTPFTSLSMQAPTAGTYPYEATVYPLRGDVPSGYTVATVDDSSMRASILSTHDDFSAAVVVMSGSLTFASANQTKMVALKAAVSAGGTDLTAARIQALVSTIAVNFTATYGGTATLSNVQLGSPERIWWANPQVICARYRLAAPTPGSTQLEAVIDVHAYASSARAFVEAVVENGKVWIGIDTAPAAATYTNMSVSVNGSTIATVSSPASTTVRGTSIYTAATHQQFRAFYASGWVGGDPGLAVTHDTAYLQRHPLFPFIDQPTSKDFSRTDQNGFGFIPATMAYTPWTIAEQRPSMAAGGDDVSLGLFPKWDMQYIQTGNKHAANAVRVNALAALSYPINYRDSATGVLPTFDQTMAAGVGRSSGLPQLSYGSGVPSSLPYWEEEHPPAVGLVAFLTRPSPVFIEIAQKAAFFQLTWGAGSQGLFNRAWAGRSKAWATRALSHAIFLTPTTLPSGGSHAASEVTNWRSAAKDCVGRNVAAQYASWVSTPLRANPLKVMWSGTPHASADEAIEEQPANSGFEMSIWQHWWLAVATHRLDRSGLMTGHTQASNLTAFADWALALPAKMVNESTGGEWRYHGKLATIGTTGHASSTGDDVGDPGIYATWAAAYLARRGAAPSLAGTFNYAFGNVQTSYASWDPETGARTMADSYSVIFAETLATAAERGVTGAASAWTTVTANVTNWDTWRTGLRADPRAAHAPRTLSGSNYVNPNWPAWRRAMVPGTWAKVGTTMHATANAQLIAALNPLFGSGRSPWYQIPDSETHATLATGAIEGFPAIIDDWCGATIDDDRLYVNGGGHNGYAGNEVISIDLSAASPAWRIERPPTGWDGHTSEGITLSDRREDLRIYSNGDPRSAHTYDMLAWGNGGMYTMPTATFQEPSGVENLLPAKIFKFTPGANPVVGTDASYGTWAHVATLPVVGPPEYNWNSSSLVYDSTRNYLYAIGANRAIYRYNLTGSAWLSNGPGTGASTDSDHRSIYVASLDLVVIFNHIPSSKFIVYKPSTNTLHSPGSTGTVPAPTRSGVGSSTTEYFTAANWIGELGCFVSWAEGGAGFHTLTPPSSGDPTTTAWVWGRLEASAANTVTPDVRQSNGEYGRFFYSPSMKCLGVVTGTNSGTQQSGVQSSGQLNIFALP